MPKHLTLDTLDAGNGDPYDDELFVPVTVDGRPWTLHAATGTLLPVIRGGSEDDDGGDGDDGGDDAGDDDATPVTFKSQADLDAVIAKRIKRAADTARTDATKQVRDYLAAEAAKGDAAKLSDADRKAAEAETDRAAAAADRAAAAIERNEARAERLLVKAGCTAEGKARARLVAGLGITAESTADDVADLVDALAEELPQVFDNGDGENDTAGTTRPKAPSSTATGGGKGKGGKGGGGKVTPLSAGAQRYADRKARHAPAGSSGAA